MIIEGIVTTERPDGSMHVAPMGPWVNPELTEWSLKPFQTSTTFANLQVTQRCIFHVVDDALMLAQAVLGQTEHLSAEFDAEVGYRLQDACHWYALRMDHWDTTAPRAVANATMVRSGTLRRFFGWNRAKHAVIEASILASRLHLFRPEEIRQQLEQLRPLVEKTAGPREHSAYQLLVEHIDKHLEQGQT